MISDMMLITSSKDTTAKVRTLKYYNDMFNNTIDSCMMWIVLKLLKHIEQKDQ